MDTLVAPVDFPLGLDETATKAFAPAIPHASALQISVVRDKAEFEALRAEWTELFESCGRPQQVFQTFEWLSIWAETYLDKRNRLSIVTGRVDGKLVVAWPLVVHRMYGLRVLTGMGDPLSQYDDALVSPDLAKANADALFDFVVGLPVDVISFRRVREDSAIGPILRRRLGAPTNPQASPFVELVGLKSAQDFEARFPSKLRSSRRRRRRRLEERGPVRFVSHGPSAEAVRLIETALAFKREWAHQNGIISPSLRDPRFEACLAAAAQPGDKTPDLRVSALTSGDDILGIEVSVVCRGHVFGHVLAPNPAFQGLGVGGVLAESTILHAREQGFVVVELLAPADPYKVEWTNKSVPVGDYCLSRGLMGLAYTELWLKHGRNAAKKLAGRLRPTVARLTQGAEPTAKADDPA